MDEKLKDAFYKSWVGEAKAALRLKIYAAKALAEGYPQMARLFRAVARSEEIHGERSLRQIREIGATEENLAASFESETRVAGVAYEEFMKMALALGKDAAATVFSQAKDVEEGHAKLYKEAMNHLMEERETVYYVCEVCGYVSDGVLPDQCPVCGAKKEMFEKLE